MRLHTKIAVAAATMAIGAAPALAIAASPGNSGSAPGHNKTGTTTQPSAISPSQAKAFGRACQGESKKHVAGTPGTPFSKCVTAMAKLENGSVKNPRTACATESKKHVAGTPGTPFSRCVSAAAKLHSQKK
jgi:hypothetical protein